MKVLVLGGAVMGLPYGELESPASWRIIERIVHEAFAVVAAEGVNLPWVTANDYLAHLWQEHIPATARYQSSVVQDLSRSRSTETDFINGVVVEKGRFHGVPTPCNALMVNLIKFHVSLVSKGDVS